MIKLPEEAPAPIVDPMIQMHLGTDVLEIPAPRAVFRDDYTLEHWPTPEVTSYLFTKTNLADTEEGRRKREEIYAIGKNLDRWVGNLDANRIRMGGCILPAEEPDETFDKMSDHADRVFVHLRVDPHSGMRGIRRLTDLATRYPFIRSVTISPFAVYPFVHANSKECYPIYAKCVELDLAVSINVGFPGPRIPAWVQDPIHLDEVCWFFPDLRVVMKHGGEPWEDVCVKMMLRWPNLYYTTTGMSPKRYPKAITHYLKSRGADKIIFSGYWPVFSYEQVFELVAQLDLKPETWTKFLSENARTAFKLDF